MKKKTIYSSTEDPYSCHPINGELLPFIQLIVGSSNFTTEVLCELFTLARVKQKYIDNLG